MQEGAGSLSELTAYIRPSAKRKGHCPFRSKNKQSPKITLGFCLRVIK